MFENLFRVNEIKSLSLEWFLANVVLWETGTLIGILRCGALSGMNYSYRSACVGAIRVALRAGM